MGDRRAIWAGLAIGLLTIGATVLLTVAAVPPVHGFDWANGPVLIAVAAIMLGVAILTSLLRGFPFSSLRPSRLPETVSDAVSQGLALAGRFPDRDETLTGGEHSDLREQTRVWIKRTYAALKIVDARAAAKFGDPPSMEFMGTAECHQHLLARLLILNKLR